MRRSALALLVAAACRSQAGQDTGPPAVSSGAVVDASSVATAPAPTPSSAPAAVTTDWCIEGLPALDEDVCYVLPAFAAGQPRTLLVYLHGIVPRQPDSPQKRTFETAVLHASLRAGAAALVPRGRRDIGPGQARDWWAWPTTPGAVAELTPSIVARWTAAKKKLEALAGAPFERTYLAGSSNGAYYLTALAVRGDLPTTGFPVDGFGAMSGGAAGAGAAERLARRAPRPFYVGFGTYDGQSKANAGPLVDALRAAHWPVRAAEHPLSHGANEVYLDEAFELWMGPDAGR
jgi:predicted esterase